MSLRVRIQSRLCCSRLCCISLFVARLLQRSSRTLWIAWLPCSFAQVFAHQFCIELDLQNCGLSKTKSRHERELILKYQPVFVEPHRDLIKPAPHHAMVRTLARILGFYIETVFELIRVSNKEFGYLAAERHLLFVLGAFDTESIFPRMLINGHAGLHASLVER